MSTTVRQLEPHEIIQCGDLYGSSRTWLEPVDGSAGMPVEEAMTRWPTFMWYRYEEQSITDGF